MRGVHRVSMLMMLALTSCRKPDVHAEQAKTFRRAWSAQPASSGPLFNGLTVGGPGDMSALYDKLHGQFSKEYEWTSTGDNPKLRAMLAASRLVINVESRNGKISELGLWTNHEHDVGCPADLEPEIRRAWNSAPHATSRDLQIWLDPAHQVRALLNVGAQCRLTFEGYQPEDTWLEKVTRIDLVGSPASQIESQIAPMFGATMVRDPAGRFLWNDLGCGLGGGSTSITARTANDRIVSVTAATFVADATFQVVLAKLAASYGQPIEVTGLSMRRLEWTNGTPLRVDHRNGQLEVTRGVFSEP